MQTVLTFTAQMILVGVTNVTALSLASSIGFTDAMTANDEHPIPHTKSDPQPANEALPDGQFQDQQMPTTDGEPAEPNPRPTGADEAESTDSEGTAKPAGLGEDSTIPRDPDGLAAGHTGTASTFEPEEDEQAE